MQIFKKNKHTLRENIYKAFNCEQLISSIQKEFLQLITGPTTQEEISKGMLIASCTQGNGQ
jgi:transcriptional regulatory protein LevR